jgi:YHS domain-containing protein
VSRLIFYLIIFAIVYWVVKQALSPAKRKITKPGDTSEEMVQDPVCQCYISKKQSYSVFLGGKELFFCSEECYKKYLASHAPPKT